MKLKKKRWLGLAFAPALFALIGFASPARATDYSGDCAGIAAFNGQGNVTINEAGSCTLNQAVTASGWIRITAGGSINAQGLTSQNDEVNLTGSGAINITGPVSTRLNTKLKGSSVTATTLSSQWGIQVEATSGTLSLGDVTSNSNGTEFGTNIMLTATGNIGVGNVKNNGTSTTAGIEIRANTGGSNVPFRVGGGGTNGSGTLSISTATGGGTDPYYMPGGIYVNSGPSGGTASGIIVSAMSDLTVTSPGSRSGILILDAQGGTLTLPAGTLGSDGSGSQGAGLVTLMAQTITTVDGTVVSASQTTSGYNHGVNIAASTINLASGTLGLQVKADGNGITGSSGSAYVSILPKDGVTVTFTGDVNSRNWQVGYVSFFQKTGSVTFNGANALLKVNANGDYSRVSMSAYPMSFKNKTVTIQARGTVDHIVQIGYSGAFTNQASLEFTGTGVVSIDANATTGTGGGVSLFGDKFTFNAPTFNINANGPTSGNGDGGTVYVGSSALTLSQTSKMTVTANAASAAGATGNAVLGDVSTGAPKAILFYPGPVNLNIGTAANVGQVSFAAKGGTAGGNGGTIVISSDPVNIKTANAVNASAMAGNGDGGEIFFGGYIQSFDPGATVTAIGKGAGKGGKFTAFHNIVDIDILTFVKVDAGPTVPVANLAGYITLNNVPCRQWKLSGTQAWPKTYWVCTAGRDNPLPLSTDTAAADVAKSAAFNSLRARFANAANKAEIFVFAGSAGFNAFWRESLPSNAGGLTFKSALASTRIYVNPWQSGSIGNPNVVVNYNYNQTREVAAHELGHALDRSFAGAGTLPSRDVLYSGFVVRDTNTLDYADPAFAIRRLPCVLTPNPAGGNFPGKIPFAGVVDTVTGLNVCVAGQLNNALINGGWPAGTFNSQVLTTLEGSLWIPVAQTSPAWVEPHAQLFSYGAVGNQGGKPFSNKVFDNGYFPCLKSWATSERGNALPVAACALNPTP